MAFWRSLPLRQFREGILALKPKDMTLHRLATKAHVNRVQISQWFNQNRNLTLDSMVKVAMALDARVHIHVAPKDQIVDWFESPREELQGDADATGAFGSAMMSYSWGPWGIAAMFGPETSIEETEPSLESGASFWSRYEESPSISGDTGAYEGGSN